MDLSEQTALEVVYAGCKIEELTLTSHQPILSCQRPMKKQVPKNDAAHSHAVSKTLIKIQLW